MIAISRGDSGALSNLYDGFSDCVYDRCYEHLSCRDAAEDATQDIFMKIWDRAKTFKPRKGDASQWIEAVIRNHCIDLLRKKKPAAEPEICPADREAAPPLEAVELRIDSHNVMEKLRTLAPAARELISLHFIQGFSFPEISRLTGIPEPTAKSRTRRALMSLRQQTASSTSEF